MFKYYSCLLTLQVCSFCIYALVMIDFYNWVSELATLEEFPDLQSYFIIDCVM